jgi:predicted RNA-binding Zn-ribbon protein involved in translation (DUF1610 family)
MNTLKKIKLSKSLDWTLLNGTTELIEFDCPKCLQKNSFKTSVFNTNTYQDSEELQLTDQKLDYADKGMIVLANIIAFGITVVILFGFFGELMSSGEYGALIYLPGIAIMFVLGRIIIPFFRKPIPIWSLKCKNCGEQIILSSNGLITHLARETASAKKRNQDRTGIKQKQTEIKSTENRTLWDLRNGDFNTKFNAANKLIMREHTNIVEIILEQALKENPVPDNRSFFKLSDKTNFLMILDKNIKRIKTPESVNAYIKVLSSGDKEIIEHAIPQLGFLGSQKAIEPLEKMLREGSFENPDVISLLTEVAIKRIKKKNRIPIE